MVIFLNLFQKPIIIRLVSSYVDIVLPTENHIDTAVLLSTRYARAENRMLIWVVLAIACTYGSSRFLLFFVFFRVQYHRATRQHVRADDLSWTCLRTADMERD